MFNFDKINLSFSYNGIFFFLGLILLTAYAVYMYRYTLPPVGSMKKTLLVLLRTLALILLLFIIFEPVLTLLKRVILQPITFVFMDNSRSIKIKDGTQRSENIIQFGKGLNDNDLSTGSRFFAFGSHINPFSYDSLTQLGFSEGSTNFSDIFTFIKDQKANIASVVIVTDGVITEGTNPLFNAEKLKIPVFTIGVGDTTKRNDILIKNVLHNEFIYAETPTTISAAILNRGFGSKSAVISLYEEGILLEQRNITLSADGTQNETFSYTPKTGGEKKLTLEVDNHYGEFTFENNRHVFYINVLSNKVKVFILAGSPSTDLAFIKNSLEEEKNLSVKSLTQTAPGKYIENIQPGVELDSAHVIILVGFPSRQTDADLLNKVKNAIKAKGKPFMLILEDNTDLTKLKTLQSELPFIINKIDDGFSQVQPVVQSSENENPVIRNESDNPADTWNNLPPVYMTNSEISSRPESEIIVKARLNNTPLNTPMVVSRRIGTNRSLAVLAGGIWRWKLQTATKKLTMFDSFIQNSIKWLRSTEEQRQVTIRTSKKLYAAGEPIEFSAEVYDASFNPVADAELKISITNSGKQDEVILNSLGSGLYEGTYSTTRTGDFQFTGKASRNGKVIGTDRGSFNIGEIDIEQLNPVTDYEFLTSLSENTGGKYFYYSEMNKVYPLLKNIRQNASKEKPEVTELRLWSDEWLLIIVIILFGTEWFIRKQSGML